jgi:hypothetical protein
MSKITEQCSICKCNISLEVEHYLILDERKGVKQLAKTYYHKKCFMDKMLVQRDMKGMIGNMMGLVSGIKKKMDINEEKEYIIN